MESDEFRKAMARLGAAVNVVTSDGVAGRCGLTASAVCSVTDTPPMLLVCINRASIANQVLKANGVLCVNVLASHHGRLSDRFAGRLGSADRFAGDAAWDVMETGSPALQDASAVIDCRIESTTEVGTHSILFCAPLSVRISEFAQGLIYFDRAYHPVPAGAVR